MTELQRASAIAIVLGDDVRTALDELETQWLNATRQKTSLGETEERYAAVQKARHSVEATARRHLRSSARRATRRDCRATVTRATSPTPKARKPENVVRASGCRGASDHSGRSSRTRLFRHAHFGGNAATSAAR